ncbi:MAG: hypothetical protein IJ849_11170, partial [Selenomonadaceae bacterium]|nr:hypothetical protein [Selenomonadaceae bacterium]
KPRTKIRNLCKLGVPFDIAYQAGNCRRGYWWTSNTLAVKMALTKERLIRFGCYDLAKAYQSICTSTTETAVYRTVRTVV